MKYIIYVDPQLTSHPPLFDHELAGLYAGKWDDPWPHVPAYVVDGVVLVARRDEDGERGWCAKAAGDDGEYSPQDLIHGKCSGATVTSLEHLPKHPYLDTPV